MSKGKIITISILAIICAFCIGLDAWYLYVYFNGPEKIAAQTFKVGLQTLADGTEKPLAEIKLYNNAFEFKWNYILDEDRTDFYSQGTQIIGNNFGVNYQYDPSTEIKTTSGKFWWKENYISYCGRYVFNSDLDIYNYSSGNDFEDTLNTANQINDDTLFKLTLNVDGQNKVYAMKFKGGKDGNNFRNVVANGRERIVPKGIGVERRQVHDNRGQFNQIETWIDYFYYYDYSWFLNLMYNSIQSLSVGVNHNIVFEFGDYFDYFEYDAEKGVYSETSVDLDKAAKISAAIKSYYVIKCTIIDSDLIKASDSLFNCFAGNSNYNATDDYSSDDYFIGRTIVTADIYDFDLVQVLDNNYCLKLKDSFINYYKQFKDSIYIDVVIDLDILEKLNFNFVGFTEDSGLDNFTIHKCVTHKSQDGQIVESEVQYV